MYVGRFAPSPTGPLHFGSFVAALASWLDARAASGRWLVRIEDLDVPRQQPGAADQILRTLDRLGLHWDGSLIFQSHRIQLYQRALDALRNQTFWCGCSRREIADSSLGPAADGAQIYPGTCRAGVPAGKPRRALRVRAGNERVAFRDRVQGEQSQNVAAQVGDFVIYRADGVFAYQLAVVVDDADQQISDVVRGADLLDSTARQIHLQRLLGYARPRYLHVPVVATAAGEKLSKQSGAPPIDLSQPEALLRKALRFLGQVPNDNLVEAIRDWEPSRIPASRSAIVPAEQATQR
jgi:glutamyl-Q tRNA(Asp) synthetase